jgi:hypothetical protein
MSRKDSELTAALVCAILCLSALAGCQRGEELGHVTGKVTYRGQPVTPGFVIFANTTKGVYMTAPLDAEGQFEVAMAQGFGLPLGEYAIGVSPPLMDHPLGPIAEPPEADKRKDIPRRYRDPATSDLKHEVKSGENVIELDLEP